jgi:hypothetical protein
MKDDKDYVLHDWSLHMVLERDGLRSDVDDLHIEEVLGFLVKQLTID